MIHLICNKYAQRSGRITFSVPKASSVRHWDLGDLAEPDLLASGPLVKMSRALNTCLILNQFEFRHEIHASQQRLNVDVDYLY